MPAVCLILPVYSVEPYMARCTRSLFGQSLQDIEYIFIDDCTPDHSIDVMRDLLADYPERKNQVFVYRMPQNSGQEKVRMQGISLTTGDYVIHCDSDDEIDTDMYRQMYEKAVDDDLDIVSCDIVRVLPNGDSKYYSQASKPGEELSDVLFSIVGDSLCSRLIRKSLLMNIVPPIGNYCEDVVISCQAICKSRRFGHVPSVLYHYFIHESSISFIAHSESVREGTLVNASILAKILQDKYIFRETPHAIVFFKYHQRDYLVPYVHIPECYRR